MSQDIFQTTEVKPVQDTLDPGKTVLEQLVGEGKKFSDAEALARGKFEGDNHIKTLEAELALLRREHEEVKGELSKNMTANEIFEEIRKIKPETTPVTTQTEPEVKSNSLDKQTVADMMKEALSEFQTEQKADNNLSKSMTVLQEKFGDKAQEVLNVKSQQLGMSMDQLKQMASQNSTAFLQLVGANDVKPQVSSQSESVSTSTQVTGVQPPEKRGYSYFQEIRKKDPARYRSPEVQNEMFKLAAEGGDDFLNS